MGTRFSRDAHLGETIGRGEYRWKTGKNDWQLSVERAFNSLDQKGGLFQLNPDGEFVEVPFPEGSGKVTEVRYESIATLSRPLASNLDLQVAAGGETRMARPRRRRSHPRANSSGPRARSTSAGIRRRRGTSA